MCFVPQRRALFRHLNFQKWSEHVVLLTFLLRNVLRATMACAFSTSQLPKVARTWCVSLLVHFDFEMCFAPQRRAIFHLSSGQLAPHPPLSRAYFWSLRGHKPLEKHSASRLYYLFAHLDLLSSDSFSSLLFASLRFASLLFSSLTLPTSALHLSILSEVWLLNFLRSCVWLGGAYVGGKKAPSNVFWGKLYLARWAPTPREAPLRNMNASVCFGMHFWTVCARAGLMVQMCRMSLLTQGSQWTDNQLRIQHSHFIEVSGLPDSGTNRSPQSYDRNLQEREHKPQRSLAESVLGSFAPQFLRLSSGQSALPVWHWHWRMELQSMAAFSSIHSDRPSWKRAQNPEVIPPLPMRSWPEHPACQFSSMKLVTLVLFGSIIKSVRM